MSAPEGQNTFLSASDGTCPMCQASVSKLKQHVCAGTGPSEFEKRGHALLDAVLSAPNDEAKTQALRELTEHIRPRTTEARDVRQLQTGEEL